MPLEGVELAEELLRDHVLEVLLGEALPYLDLTGIHAWSQPAVGDVDLEAGPVSVRVHPRPVHGDLLVPEVRRAVETPVRRTGEVVRVEAVLQLVLASRLRRRPVHRGVGGQPERVAEHEGMTGVRVRVRPGHEAERIGAAIAGGGRVVAPAIVVEGAGLGVVVLAGEPQRAGGPAGRVRWPYAPEGRAGSPGDVPGG